MTRIEAHSTGLLSPLDQSKIIISDTICVDHMVVTFFSYERL